MSMRSLLQVGVPVGIYITTLNERIFGKSDLILKESVLPFSESKLSDRTSPAPYPGELGVSGAYLRTGLPGKLLLSFMPSATFRRHMLRPWVVFTKGLSQDLGLTSV